MTTIVIPSTIHDAEKMDKYIDELTNYADETCDMKLTGAVFLLRMFHTVWQGSVLNGNTRRRTLDSLLIGKEVKANHPVTVLNPSQTFKIIDYKIEYNRLSVRGEETCWFGIDLIEFKE